MVAAQDARARAPATHRQSASVIKKAPAVAAAPAPETQSFRETAQHRTKQNAMAKKTAAHAAAKASAAEHAAEHAALHSDMLCGEGQSGDCAPQESCFFPNTRFDVDDATCKQLGVTYGCCYHRVHAQGDQGQTYTIPMYTAPKRANVVSAAILQIYSAACGNDANVHSGQCLNSGDCHDYHDGISLDTDGSGGSGCAAGRICCDTKTPQPEPASQSGNPLFDHDTDKLNELGNGVVMTDALPDRSLDVSRDESAASSTSTVVLTTVLAVSFATLIAVF